MVPNPLLKHGGWYNLDVQLPPREGNEATHKMSVGKFVDDKYHLLDTQKLIPRETLIGNLEFYNLPEIEA